jgi:hypothetical protein
MPLEPVGCAVSVTATGADACFYMDVAHKTGFPFICGTLEYSSDFWSAPAGRTHEKTARGRFLTQRRVKLLTTNNASLICCGIVLTNSHCSSIFLG